MPVIRYNELRRVLDPCPRMQGKQPQWVELDDCVRCRLVGEINKKKRLLVCCDIRNFSMSLGDATAKPKALPQSLVTP